MIMNLKSISKQHPYQSGICAIILLHMLYFVGNYVVLKTATENLVFLEKNVEIPESNEIDHELNKLVQGVNPVQWPSINSQASVSSQAGHCMEPGRYWIYSETMMEGTSKWKTFKLLSYNVLAQALLEQHPYLYRENPKEALDWNFRSRLLFAEIKYLDADILCLQEVEEKHVPLFQLQLQLLGYQFIYKKRSHERVDGVAIFYKTKTFLLQEFTTVEFFQPNVSVLNRDNVALVAKFALRDSPSERVVIATTHLLFNMKRHDVKLAQIQLLLAEVERFAYAGEGAEGTVYLPVIITGDMNFKPFTGVHNFLTEGQLHYEGLLKKNLTKRSVNEKGNSGPVFNNVLLPRWLQVTDSCQHLGVLPLRKKGIPVRSEEVKHIKIQNSDFRYSHKQQMPAYWTNRMQQFTGDVESSKLLRSLMPQTGSSQIVDLNNKTAKVELDGDEVGLHSDKFGSGQLSHPFNFQSVFSDLGEVTTFHNSWITVDYIFYSIPKNKLEGGLTVLGTYKLPTSEEADRLGRIPNTNSPSDHYPLLVLFGLGSELQKK